MTTFWSICFSGISFIEASFRINQSKESLRMLFQSKSSSPDINISLNKRRKWTWLLSEYLTKQHFDLEFSMNFCRRMQSVAQFGEGNPKRTLRRFLQKAAQVYSHPNFLPALVCRTSKTKFWPPPNKSQPPTTNRTCLKGLKGT